MKGKSKDYYKLVINIGNRYFSFLYTVEYKLDEWVKTDDECRQKEYLLTVFENLKNVKDFILYNGALIKSYFHSNLLVFKCKIKNKVNRLPKKLLIENGKIQWDKINLFGGWPEGTIMTEQVKIYGEPIDIMR